MEQKSGLLFEETNFGVTVSFVCLVVLGRGVCVSPLMLPRGKMRAR